MDARGAHRPPRPVSLMVPRQTDGPCSISCHPARASIPAPCHCERCRGARRSFLPRRVSAMMTHRASSRERHSAVAAVHRHLVADEHYTYCNLRRLGTRALRSTWTRFGALRSFRFSGNFSTWQMLGAWDTRRRLTAVPTPRVRHTPLFNCALRAVCLLSRAYQPLPLATQI